MQRRAAWPHRMEKVANIRNELLKSDVSTSTILTRNTQNTIGHYGYYCVLSTLARCMSAISAIFLLCLLDVSQITDRLQTEHCTTNLCALIQNQKLPVHPHVLNWLRQLSCTGHHATSHAIVNS